MSKIRFVVHEMQALPLEEPSSTSLETAELLQSVLYKSCLNLKLAQVMGFLSQLFFL